MCMAMNGNSIASASGNIAEITEYEEIVAVDVVDVNGNLLGTVDMPRGVILGTVTGAQIIYNAIVYAYYSGTAWVILNPQGTEFALNVAINFWNDAQAFLGQLSKLFFNGQTPTSAVKTNGNQCQYHKPTGVWNCMYSL